MPSRRSIFVIGALAFLALSVLGNLDATLRQMHEPGAVSGGVTDIASPFTSSREANDLQRSWRAWDDYLDARSDAASKVKDGREVLAHPGTIVATWLFVDSFFFAPLLWWALRRLGTRRSIAGGRWWRWLVVVPAFAAAYLSFDELENVLTALFVFHHRPSYWFVRIASAGKVVFLAAAVAPLVLSLVLPGDVAPLEGDRIRNLAVRLRIPIAIAGAVGFMFILLPGAIRPQLADVVRSWSPDDHLSALAWTAGFLVVLMASIWFAGAIAIETTKAPSPPRPVSWAEKHKQLAGVIVIAALTGAVKVFTHGDLVFPVGFIVAGAWLLNLVCTFATVEVATRPADSPDARRTLAVCVSAPALFLVALVLRSTQLSNFDWPTVLLVLAAGVALLVFLAVLYGLPKLPPLPASTGVLGLIAVGVVAIAFAVWLASSVVDHSWTLGAVAIVLLALVIATVGLGLLGLMRRPPRGWFSLVGMHRPPILCAVIGTFMLTGAFDKDIGFHNVRMVSQPTNDAATRHATDLGAAVDTFAANSHSSVAAGATASDTRDVVPLFVLVSSGGGARAAYWTLLATNCLFGGQSPSNLKRPLKECRASTWDNVFVASGSSGGSVGLAMYAAQDAAGEKVVPADSVFEDGDVDPVMAGLLFGDLPERAPHTQPLARPRRAARAGMGGEAPILETRPVRDPAGRGLGGRARCSAPAGADAQQHRGRRRLPDQRLGPRSRRRIRRSQRQGTDVPLARAVRELHARPADSFRPLSSSRDVNDFVCGDVRLSTAALLSARFPFISPTGAMEACAGSNARPGQHTFAVDGGYVDSSGASPVVEMLDVATSSLEARLGPDTCVQPVVLQLDNGYDELTKFQEPGRPSELLAPVTGIGVASAGRSESAKQELAIEATRPRCDAATIGDRQTYMHVYPRARPGIEAPLGWSLSFAARNDMQDQLASGTNVSALCNAQRWLGGPDRACPVVAVTPPALAAKARLPGHGWFWLFLGVALLAVLAIAIPYLVFYFKALIH